MIEKITSTKVLYEGYFLDFKESEVEIHTEEIIQSRRQYVTHPGGVCVIPILDNGDIILIKQFRMPIGEVIYEIPAGKIDPGEHENTLLTAKRELKEETGYTAKTWIDLGKLIPSPGYSTELLYLYLAKDLEAGEQDLDHGEVVENFSASMNEITEMIHDGRIRDTKTISAIFLAQKYL